MEGVKNESQLGKPLSPDEVEENAQRLLGRLNFVFKHTKLPEFRQGDTEDYYLQEWGHEERGIVFSVPRGDTTEKYVIVRGADADYVTICLTTTKGGNKLSEEYVIVQPKSLKGAAAKREPAISYKMDSTGKPPSESKNTTSALGGAEELTAKLEKVLSPTPAAV